MIRRFQIRVWNLEIRISYQNDYFNGKCKYGKMHFVQKSAFKTFKYDMHIMMRAKYLAFFATSMTMIIVYITFWITVYKSESHDVKRNDTPFICINVRFHMTDDFSISGIISDSYFKITD